MTIDTIVAYGRIIEEEKTYILYVFATTNPFLVSQKTGLTIEEINQRAMNEIWMRRTIAAKHGIPAECPIIYAGQMYAETEDEILGEAEHCRYVGDYMDTIECLYRINREIKAFFKPKEKQDILKEFIIPMTTASTYEDTKKLFELQSRFIEAYQGTLHQKQAENICRLIRQKEGFATICKYAKLLEATQKEDYETAAQIKKSLDNHARRVYK